MAQDSSDDDDDSSSSSTSTLVKDGNKGSDNNNRDVSSSSSSDSDSDDDKKDSDDDSDDSSDSDDDDDDEQEGGGEQEDDVWSQEKVQRPVLPVVPIPHPPPSSHLSDSSSTSSSSDDDDSDDDDSESDESLVPKSKVVDAPSSKSTSQTPSEVVGGGVGAVVQPLPSSPASSSSEGSSSDDDDDDDDSSTDDSSSGDSDDDTSSDEDGSDGSELKPVRSLTKPKGVSKKESAGSAKIRLSLKVKQQQKEEMMRTKNADKSGSKKKESTPITALIPKKKKKTTDVSLPTGKKRKASEVEPTSTKAKKKSKVGDFPTSVESKKKKRTKEENSSAETTTAEDDDGSPPISSLGRKNLKKKKKKKGLPLGGMSGMKLPMKGGQLSTETAFAPTVSASMKETPEKQEEQSETPPASSATGKKPDVAKSSDGKPSKKKKSATSAGGGPGGPAGAGGLSTKGPNMGGYIGGYMDVKSVRLPPLLSPGLLMTIQLGSGIATSATVTHDGEKVGVEPPVEESKEKKKGKVGNGDDTPSKQNGGDAKKGVDGTLRKDPTTGENKDSTTTEGEKAKEGAKDDATKPAETSVGSGQPLGGGNQKFAPSDLFEIAMANAGYTLDRRKKHPFKGSSTKRIVDDLFDRSLTVPEVENLLPKEFYNAVGSRRDENSETKDDAEENAMEIEKDGGEPLVESMIGALTKTLNAAPSPGIGIPSFMDMIPVSLVEPYGNDYQERFAKYSAKVQTRERLVAKWQKIQEAYQTASDKYELDLEEYKDSRSSSSSDDDDHVGKKKAPKKPPKPTMTLDDIPPIPEPPKPPPVTDDDESQFKEKCQHLVGHLDPKLFKPTQRYHNLLSNRFVDPQYYGPNAPGLTGLTLSNAHNPSGHLGNSAAPSTGSSGGGGGSGKEKVSASTAGSSKSGKAKVSAVSGIKGSGVSSSKVPKLGRGAGESVTKTHNDLKTVMEGPDAEEMRLSLVKAAWDASMTGYETGPWRGADGEMYPEVSKAFSVHAGLRPCARCKNNKQGAYHCRLRRKHRDVDYDGDGNSSTVLDPFREQEAQKKLKKSKHR